ncbi:MAG: histidinol phosphatase [Desulfobacterales bacterium]|nr:MAG: histidinol phosphatase [Desulfobacterales bacterium]
MKTNQFISLHGGHSGQFCDHAKDSLEDIIRAYVAKGFKVVGISEHMPMPSDDLRYPDEIELGVTVADLKKRFAQYFETLNQLKRKYQDQITIYRGFETEMVTGSLDLAKQFIQEFEPDYIVGSVHHVNDRCFDYSQTLYESIIQHCGSVEAMYLNYFDAQFEMIQTLRPFVVGHFDIIRIYDKDYINRLERPAVKEKIQRNLKLIKTLGLVLDYNQRPLARGEKYPYLAPTILKLAKAMGIRMVPGDDSHGAAQAGGFIAEAVNTLEELGVSTQWPIPRLMPRDDSPQPASTTKDAF